MSGTARGNTDHTRQTSTKRMPIALVVMIAFVLLVCFLRLWVGSSALGLPDVHDPYGARTMELRFTRLQLALLAGAALAWSGLALQALLRNPLAEPYLLGLSTGAGAGVMAQAALAMAVGVQLPLGYEGALAGSLLAIGVVYGLARRNGVLDPLGLLLTGVVVATIGGALILAANAMAGPGGVRDDLMNWMMGELTVGHAVGGSTDPRWPVLAVTLLGGAWLAWRSDVIDIATLSRAEAESLGVPIARLRTGLFLTAGLLAAGAVVLAGPIAFVGLIAPHLGRLLVGPSHRRLVWITPLIGGALVVLADTAGSAWHLWLARGRMPLGVFTALIGGPVFLLLLRPHLGRGLES